MIKAVYQVVDPGFSFDNVGESLLTLLDISTLEGWIDVMFVLQDIAGNSTCTENYVWVNSVVLYVQIRSL